MSARRLPVVHDRPVRRSECKGGVRPCPNVWCKSNMMVDHTENGGIVLNSGLADDERGEGAGRIWRPTLPKDPAERAAEARAFNAEVDAVLDWWIYRTDRARRLGCVMPDSCLEDILDRMTDGEEMLLEDVGAKMFITRERARQIEETGLRQLKAGKDRLRRLLQSDEAQRRVRSSRRVRR